MNISEEAKKKLAEIRKKENEKKEFKEMVRRGICPQCGSNFNSERLVVWSDRYLSSPALSTTYLILKCSNNCNYNIAGEGYSGFKRVISQYQSAASSPGEGEVISSKACLFFYFTIK